MTPDTPPAIIQPSQPTNAGPTRFYIEQPVPNLPPLRPLYLSTPPSITTSPVCGIMITYDGSQLSFSCADPALRIRLAKRIRNILPEICQGKKP